MRTDPSTVRTCPAVRPPATSPAASPAGSTVPRPDAASRPELRTSEPGAGSGRWARLAAAMAGGHASRVPF